MAANSGSRGLPLTIKFSVLEIFPHPVGQTADLLVDFPGRGLRSCFNFIWRVEWLDGAVC